MAMEDVTGGTSTDSSKPTEDSLLEKITLAELLLAAQRSESATQQLSVATRRRSDKDLAPKAVAEQIRESILHLRDKFALAQALAEVAENMRLVDEQEEYIITSGYERLEKFTAGLSGGLVLVGGAFYLLTGNSYTAILPTLGSVLSVAIGNFFQTSGDKAQSSKAVDAIKQATSYAKRKAEALAVHVYLSIELKGTAETLRAISDELEKIFSRPWDDESKIKDLAKAYSTVIKSVDGFYDYQLAKIHSAVKGRSNSEIFSEDTRDRLTELAKSIQEAKNTWADVRYIYARSENVAIDYIAQRDQIEIDR